MDLTESCHQPNGNAQYASQFERLSRVPLEDLIEGLAAGILEHEHRPTLGTGAFQRPGCPRGIKFGGERVLMLQPPQACQCGPFRDRRQSENEWCPRAGLAPVLAPIK